MLKEKAAVCPICWRSNCRLFLRLDGLKFAPKDKRRFFREFHRDVCCNCKKLRCDKQKCLTKKLNVVICKLPAWWEEKK